MTGMRGRPAPSPPASRHRSETPLGSAWPALCLWLLVSGLPTGLLAVDAIGALCGPSSHDALSLLLPADRRLNLFAQTLAFAGSVGVCGILVGLLAAGAVRFGHARPLRALAFLVLPMAVLPPHIHALAWASALREGNRGLRALSVWMGLPSAHPLHLPEQGFAVSVWVQTMALLPFAVGILLLAFRSLPDELPDAARLLGDGRRLALRILLPLCAPALATAFAFLFLTSLLDYSVPSLFQLNLYALDIFSSYSIAYDGATAFLLSMPMLAVSLPAAWLLQHGLRSLPLTPGRTAQSPLPLRLPIWLRMPVGCALALVLLQGLMPVAALSAASSTAFAHAGWLIDALPDMAGSLGTGLLSACITLPAALAAASALHRRKHGHDAWWPVLMLPLAMPAPLVGVGLIRVWNGAALGWTGLYNTLLMPALACTLRFLPFSALLLLTAMRRQDPLLTDAVRLLQRSRLHGLLHVRLPLLAPSLAASALLAAVLSFGELGATLLLIPPGTGSLTITVYNYLHYGQSDVVAGLGLVLFLASLAGGLLLSRLTGRGPRRLS